METMKAVNTKSLNTEPRSNRMIWLRVFESICGMYEGKNQVITIKEIEGETERIYQRIINID